MAEPRLDPDVADLDALPEDAFADAVAPLFEGAPRFLARLAGARPFGSWERFFLEARRIARGMPEPEQVELVDAHPRLGAPPGTVSDFSRREQGYDRPDHADRPAGPGSADAVASADERSVRLNEAYEARYGFRYCTFVNGRPRPILLTELADTLAAEPSRAAELARAIEAVVDIAQARREATRAPGRAPRGQEGPYSAGPMTGPIELGEHRYGKERIRLVRVVPGPGGHLVRDLTVAVSLEGTFGAAYTAGDNAGVVATDTMKNTVYALAAKHLSGPIEDFALSLARHFVEAPSVQQASVSIDEAAWRPIDGPGSRPASAFVQDRSWVRTARVSVGRAGASGADRSDASGASGAEGSGVLVRSGLRDLTLMKTAGSSFSGFPRDRFTTLAETDDRLMATRLEAEWTFGPAAQSPSSDRSTPPGEPSLSDRPQLDFEASFERVRTALLTSFADHQSPSVQATIWILGQAVLGAEPAIESIHFRLPNLHHWLVDLTPFAMVNDGTVFVATSEPFGLIEGTVRRADPRSV